jgi:outer membrane usher protein
MPPRSRRPLADPLLLGWLAFAACAATAVFAEPAADGARQPTDASTAAEEMWLAVTLNGQPSEATVLVLGEPKGHLWVRGTELESWRLPVPRAGGRSYLGEAYYPLDALAGLTYRVDEPNQALVIEAPARLFDRVRIAGTTRDYVPVPSPPLGGFFNYDTVVMNSDRTFGASALLEASVFGSAGAAVTRVIERYQDGSTRSVRLDSTWTLDRPQAAASLRVGDSITGASRWWGGAVRFGGVQWASNFATRPGLVTLPLPTLSGESALPSSLELYVNDALRLRQNVPGGPFSVQDVPLVTGDGQIRLVVRDMLGREQVITQSYYSSPRLLRPGLNEFSIEAGLARENLGIASNDYGRPLIVGTDRVGLTERLTGEIHGELLRDQQTVGLAAGLLFQGVGMLSAAVAGSRTPAGAGQLVSLGFERTARRLSVGISAQRASERFTQLGQLREEAAPRLVSQMFANLALGRLGSVSLLGARQEFRERPSVEILSARYSAEIRGLGYLSVSALRTMERERDTLFAVNFTRALGYRTSTSAGATVHAAGVSGQMQVQQSLPAGSGTGYRLRADAGETQSAYGAFSWQNEVGTYEVDAQQLGHSTLARAGASGGFAMLGERVFASRQIDSSFAVAKVGDEADVRIYRDNQLVGRTDSQGYAILPGLRAYQDNLISIEQADLPLDVAIEAMQVEAVPRFRSGVLLRFPVERSRGALLTVVLEDGEPLPVGALVQASGEGQSFPAGLRGEVYVTALEARNHLRASWRNGHCSFEMPFTPGADPLPHLGPFVCKASAP